MSSKTCPIDGCERGKRSHLAVCGWHWKRLPLTLKLELKRDAGDDVLGRVQEYFASEAEGPRMEIRDCKLEATTTTRRHDEACST